MNPPTIDPAPHTDGYLVETEAADFVETPPVPYWLHPFFLVVCCLGIPAAVTLFLPAQVFLTEWHSPKIYSLENALTVAWSILAFGGGAAAVWFWRQHARRSGARIDGESGGILSRTDWLRIVFFLTTGLTLMASVVWASFSASQGIGLDDALSALGGNSDAVMRIRAKAETIPGITTLTQLGMAAAVLAGILWYRQGYRLVRLLFTLIVIAAFLRAFLRAERLALIEVLVPFCVAVLPGIIARWRGAFFRIFLLIVPVVAVFLLIAFFVLAEAGRSYQAKVEAGTDSSVVDYGANRIGGYYGTALNNGAYLLKTLPPPKLPYFALEWLWRFPGLRDVFNPQEMTGLNSALIFSSLSEDMNIEFNNTSGIFCYEYDFGRAGLILMSFIVGGFAFILFNSYRTGLGAGRLFYPMCVIAFMELTRIPYLTSGRAFPSVALLIALITFDTFLRISARVKGHT